MDFTCGVSCQAKGEPCPIWRGRIPLPSCARRSRGSAGTSWSSSQSDAAESKKFKLIPPKLTKLTELTDVFILHSETCHGDHQEQKRQLPQTAGQEWLVADSRF